MPKRRTAFTFIRFVQSIINAHLIPPLIQLLSTAEFEVRKEAAWAISNATSGGSPEQIKCVTKFRNCTLPHVEHVCFTVGCGRFYPKALHNRK